MKDQLIDMLAGAVLVACSLVLIAMAAAATAGFIGYFVTQGVVWALRVEHAGDRPGFDTARWGPLLRRAMPPSGR